MSLKAFHLFFVTLCVAFLAFLTWFQVTAFQKSETSMDLILAIVAGVATVALVVYLPWFLRKLRNVSYV